MLVHFKVDRLAAFKAGVDTRGEIAAVEINPAELPEADRLLIARSAPSAPRRQPG